MRRTYTPALLCLVLAAVGCQGPSAPLLAHAADADLTVTRAVEMIASADVPNQPETVRTIAELWVAYSLLALEADRDSTFSDVRVEALAEDQLEQEIRLALRGQAVPLDTAVTESELVERYERDRPGAQVRARHILLRVPENAPQEVRDTVRARAEDLRRRILEGESFDRLARAYSQDPGSAAAGGDLDWFSRGQMVPEFEAVAFSLDPGEVSAVFETPFGFHVLRVEDRRAPELERVRGSLRNLMVQERTRAAESTFIAGVEEGRNIRFPEGAAALVRSFSEDPTGRVQAPALRRPVALYDGGEVTLAEVRDYLMTQDPETYWSQVSIAPDDVIENSLLRSLVQQELLLERAADEGLTVPESRLDSLSGEFRDQLVEAALALDLESIRRQPGETAAQARERRVNEVLQEMLQGTRDVVPMGAFASLLRARHSARVYRDRIDDVVAGVERIRGPDDAPVPDSSERSAPPDAPEGDRS